MIWPTLVGIDAASDSPSLAQGLIDTPYLFSIEVAQVSCPVGRKGCSFDWEIGDSQKNCALQVGFTSGRLVSVQGLVVNERHSARVDAPYSGLIGGYEGVPIFGLVPLARGSDPRFGPATVIQDARISICTYPSAAVLSFDDFVPDASVTIARCLHATVDEKGCLASLVFRDQLANYVVERIQPKNAGGG